MKLFKKILFFTSIIIIPALFFAGASSAALLHGVAAKGDISSAKVLLKKGADIDAANENGDAPLESACESGQLEMVKFLVEKGAKINAGNKDGWTPLMSAVNKRHYDIAEYLIEKGADVNCVARYKKSDDTPLLLATEKNDAGMVELLLKNGANADFVDRKGRSAMKIANAKKNDEIVKLLKAPRDIKAANEWKATPDEAIKFVAAAARKTVKIAGNMHFEMTEERVENGRTYYVVHGYEVVVDDEKTGSGHTATFGWYCVDKKTGSVYELDMATDKIVPLAN